MTLKGIIRGIFGPQHTPRPSAPSGRFQPATVHASAGGIGAATGGYFTALRQSHDRTPIPLLSPETRGWVDGIGRYSLSLIGRYLYDNTGMVPYAIDTFCNYAAPVIPQAGSDDDEWNTTAEEIFTAWSEQAEFTGRFDWEESQRQAIKSMLTDGDSIAVMVTDNGFPQIQFIEGWRVRHPSNPANNRDGVQVDAKGRIQGYWVDEPSGPRLIPANQVFHFADHDRLSSYRGITPLRRGMNDVRDVDDLKALEKLAQKIRASMPAVIEGAGALEENVWGDDIANAPGAGASQQAMKMSLAELLGGDIPSLPQGAKLNPLNGERNAEPVTDFIAALSAYFVYGLGIPPAFFLDTKATGPNTRSVNGKAQRAFNRYKKIMRRFTLWVWRRVIGDAIASGKLRSHPQWDRLTYQTPATISIDTGDEEASDREGVLNGLKTRQEIAGKRGGDWVSIQQQVAREQRKVIEASKEIAEEFGIDINIVLAANGFTAAKAVKPESKQPPA